MCSIHSIEIMVSEDSSLSLSKPLISNNESRRRVLDGVRALHGLYTTGSAETVWSTDFAPYSALILWLDKPARLPKISMFRAELFYHENH